MTNNAINKVVNVLRVVKGNAVILSVENDTLVIDAGNKSAEDLKKIASTFFKSVYKLTK